MSDLQSNVKDELSEILFVKNPKIFVIEWLPFDSNQLIELNHKLDIEKGSRKTLLTGLIDQSPDSPTFQSKGKHTKVVVKDYSLDNYVNLEAIIDIPEQEGIVQIEEMAIFVSKAGFVVYSLSLKEIDGKNTFMSLDKLSRVVADLSQDSSVLIDSLLTEFQRKFLKIIFGNPIHRPKTICYVGEEINIKHDDVNDYLDGEDCEIELNQLLGEGHKPYKVNNDLIFKGTRGSISIIEDFTEDKEFQMILWGIQHAIGSFVDSFMSRIWELYDQANSTKDIVEEAVEGNTEALNRVQEHITILTSTISVVGQIQEFLKESCIDVLGRCRKNDKTVLSECFDVEKSLITSQNRIAESEKIINGLLTELEGLRNYIATLSELQMRKMSKVMTQNTKSMNQVLQANTRTGGAIDMIELILAGSIILEVVAFAIGEISSDQTIFRSILDGAGLDKDQIATLTLFIVSIFAWIAIVVYLRWSKNRLERKALKDFFITMTVNKKINIQKLDDYMKDKEILTKRVEYEHNSVMITYVWDIGKDAELKDLDLEHVSFTYNETNSLLISIDIETSKVETDQKALLEIILSDMRKSGILD